MQGYEVFWWKSPWRDTVVSLGGSWGLKAISEGVQGNALCAIVIMVIQWSFLALDGKSISFMV